MKGNEGLISAPEVRRILLSFPEWIAYARPACPSDVYAGPLNARIRPRSGAVVFALFFWPGAASPRRKVGAGSSRPDLGRCDRSVDSWFRHHARGISDNPGLLYSGERGTQNRISNELVVFNPPESNAQDW